MDSSEAFSALVAFWKYKNLKTSSIVIQFILCQQHAYFIRRFHENRQPQVDIFFALIAVVGR
jgi:hypothetical protein